MYRLYRGSKFIDISKHINNKEEIIHKEIINILNFTCVFSQDGVVNVKPHSHCGGTNAAFSLASTLKACLNHRGITEA